MNLERETGTQELFGKCYKAGEFLPFYIPRDYMPQIDEKDYAALYGYLKSRGVQFSFGMRPLTELKAHQRISPVIADKVDVRDFNRSIMVSEDDFILDGNHRWLAHVRRGWSTIACLNIVLPFEQAITTLCHFPKAYYYADGNRHPFHQGTKTDV